jgi:molybdopterin molybdotransferase
MALTPVADALDAVLMGVAALPAESVVLDEAWHRVLAADVAALRTQPPQAMSAMDGYAVRAHDAILGAKLKVIGEVAAGRPFNRALDAGEAARIFTGGVVPDGADAIVIQEDTARDGDHVLINEGAREGRHVRKAGIDFRQGDVILKKGHRLTDRDLAVAAAMNHATLSVHRRPRIALLATGDELVLPGATPGPGQIVYSNGFALRALVRAEGADVIDLGIAPDQLDATVASIRRAREAKADILVTMGGASVGDHDLVQAALTAEGVAMAFWKIAMRPGKPMMSGRLGAMHVLGLPGNPVSSYVCATLFLVPLIRTLLGRSDVRAERIPATLGADLPANDQREDYLRATLTIAENGALTATPLRNQDSSLTSVLSVGEALIVRPPHVSASSTGSICSILKLPL